MKINQQHIQPMNIREIITSAAKRSKQVFLLSIPGNIILLFVLCIILFSGYDFLEAQGLDDTTLAVLTMFNNLLMISVTSVNIFYLLLANSKQAYIEQVKEAFTKTLKVLPIVIVATLIYAILVTLGLFLFIIPGLVLYAYLGIYAQTIVFEKSGIIHSILRSRELVKGSFWKVLLSLIGILLVTNIIVLIIGALIFSLISGPNLWVEIIVYSVSYVLFMPFIGTFYTLLYFVLRSEREAFDHETFKEELSKIITI